jgi:hypothetical protein
MHAVKLCRSTRRVRWQNDEKTKVSTTVFIHVIREIIEFLDEDNTVSVHKRPFVVYIRTKQREKLYFFVL